MGFNPIIKVSNLISKYTAAIDKLYSSFFVKLRLSSFSGSFSGSLSGSLWLSLSQAHSGSIRLNQAQSGSLRLSQALTQ